MRAGRQAARARAVEVRRGEVVAPLGPGWIIRDRGGFAPCPWAAQVAASAAPEPTDRVLDLGCGTGVLLWALRQLHGPLRALVGVERDARACDQARRTAALAAAPEALILRADVRRLPLPPAFDLVLSNPPFYPPGWGRESEDPRVAAATHALNGDVRDFAAAAAAALRPHGQAIFVFDAGALSALLLALDAADLRPWRLTFLDDDRGQPARVVACARRGGPGLVIQRRSPP